MFCSKTDFILETHKEADRIRSGRPSGEKPVEARGAIAVIKWLVAITKTRWTGVRAWLLAGGLFALAFVARLALAQWLDPVPFILFYPAVVVTTLFCGWRPGALVVVLSAIAAWFFFVGPPWTFAIADLKEVLQLASFLLVAGFMLVLVEGLVQAVLQLDETARVKEDLFHELQHRVANNLQIVAATLQRAERDIQDPAAIRAIDHALGRMHSMAGLHRQLYDSAAYAQGVEPILRAVLTETLRDLPVDLTLEIRCGELTVGEMTVIALLVNEAAINAAKHVFRPNKGTSFEVLLAQVEGGRVQLTMRDDGPGISSETAAAPQGRFGLAVMRGLAAQLGGALEILEGPGAALRVTFAREQPVDSGRLL